MCVFYKIHFSNKKILNILIVSIISFFIIITNAKDPSLERARDLGIPFDGTPGKLNAITDVKGIEVGQTTLISGDVGNLKPGEKPVRTGVTVIFPRGKKALQAPVFAGRFVLNGAGEMTGAAWVDESGFLEGPITLTNTHSVGLVHDTVIAWRIKQGPPDSEGYYWSTPLVAETDDSYLNDMNGFHIKSADVYHALNTATSDKVEEGNVGGGTGMICNNFKGGIGTASRIVNTGLGRYTVGVLVQCNTGYRENLRIAGVPIGQEIKDHDLWKMSNSIVVVIATDAPLVSFQLSRLARRASLGLGRLGSFSESDSGDFAIAFSTANSEVNNSQKLNTINMLPNNQMDPILLGAVQATEEAIVNSMIAAKTMTGVDNHTAIALPHDKLLKIMKKYNRLTRI